MTKVKTLWAVLSFVLSQQNSLCLKDDSSYWIEFCVIDGKLRDVFFNTPADNHPRLSPVCLHRSDLDFSTKRSKCFVTMTYDFQYQTNFVRPRINPFGWDLPSLRGYENSRHELAGPYPSKWTSGMVIKNCPCKNIPHEQQRRSKLPFLEDLGAVFQMSSHRVVAQSFLGARELQSGPLFGLDTSSDGTCDARSLTFATNVPVLCVPVAEQVSGTNPRWLPKYWAESRRQWCVVITLQLQVPRCDCIDVFPPPLLFRNSLDEGLVPLNTRMPVLCEWYHHFFTVFVPNLSFCGLTWHTIFFRSRSEEWPMSFGKNLRHVRQPLRNYVYKFLHFFWAVLVHRHEYDAILEIFRQNSEFFLHHVSDFTEKLQRSVPWENLPLEHDCFSINPVQLTIKSRVSKPLNFVRPRFHRLWIFCKSA